MYCGIHVYEKLDGMSAWLLGVIALRELLGMLRFVYDVRFESLHAYLNAVEATRALAGNAYRALAGVYGDEGL